MNYLKDPATSKGLSFSHQERGNLSMKGLLPPAVRTTDLEVKAVMDNLAIYEKDISKYLYLRELHDYNEKLFFRVLAKHTEQLMPLVYTPTVGEACVKYSLIFRRPKGLFLSIEDAGNIYNILGNWPETDVQAICVTDGERILGLGDLGANGMGIPVGKLALYTGLAGIPPQKTLPITIDAGTNNEKNLADEYYIGLKQKRIRGPKYDDFIDEFMQAVVKRYGKACLIQFEDFGNQNAFRLLRKYKDTYCTFNDDIQGTASVAVAGLLASLKITKTKLSENTFLFAGAGGASLGIADLIVMAMKKEGIKEAAARKCIYMIDSKGLIVKGREKNGDTLDPNKALYVKEFPHLTDVHEIVKAVKPTVLIGASAQGGYFTTEILKEVGKHSERPVIFALSNPTHKSECTAAEAYLNTEGRCVFASGSPFPPYNYKGKLLYPGQGNNAYIFPGIALAVTACKVTHISDEVFLVAAQCLAEQVKEEHLSAVRVYPPLTSIHEVSLNIATKLADYFYRHGVATHSPEPENKKEFIKSKQYDMY